MIAKSNTFPTSETFLKLQQMLAEITGNELVEILPNSSIHDDLNMTPMELAQFLALVNSTFPGAGIRRSDTEEYDTIIDLAAEIDDRLS